MEYLRDNDHIRILNICGITVYILNYQDVENVPRECFDSIYPDRLAESENFVFRADALRSLGVAVLLKDVLGLEEKDIKYEEYGKPYTDTRPISFSLSHSGDYIVLAVSANNVGVDIERLSTECMDIAGNVFTSKEIQWLNNDEDSRAKRFMQIWTLKECVSKITGLGLNTDYREFTVMPLIYDGSMIYEGYELIGDSSYELEGYCLSVCVDNK